MDPPPPPPRRICPPPLACTCLSRGYRRCSCLSCIHVMSFGWRQWRRVTAKKKKMYVSIPFDMLTNPPELMKEKERAVRKLAVKRRRKLCRYKSREGYWKLATLSQLQVTSEWLRRTREWQSESIFSREKVLGGPYYNYFGTWLGGVQIFQRGSKFSSEVSSRGPYFSINWFWGEPILGGPFLLWQHLTELLELLNSKSIGAC